MHLCETPLDHERLNKICSYDDLCLNFYLTRGHRRHLQLVCVMKKTDARVLWKPLEEIEGRWSNPRLTQLQGALCMPELDRAHGQVCFAYLNGIKINSYKRLLWVWSEVFLPFLYLGVSAGPSCADTCEYVNAPAWLLVIHFLWKNIKPLPLHHF